MPDWLYYSIIAIISLGGAWFTAMFLFFAGFATIARKMFK